VRPESKGESKRHEEFPRHNKQRARETHDDQTSPARREPAHKPHLSEF
jgi:hypothetical protein